MIFSQESMEPWKFVNKLTFRFLFAYLVLYILLLPLSLFLEAPLRWFAENILHWGSDFKMQSTGSGDRAFDYVRLGFNFALVFPIVITWSIFDRKRLSYSKFFYWFQVTLRIALFLAMLLYGFGKIFKGQFADPGLERLLQTVGELSPMGLAWTFMGHSFTYNIFIGFAELLGGMLLLFRKTVTLGSIIIVGLMTNVVMMNFTYDIPVKLLSVHLVTMALVLLLPDGNRLLNVLFRNKTAEKVNFYIPFKNTTFRKIFSKIKILVIIFLAGIILFQVFIRFDITKQLKEKSEFYGIWESQLFVMGNDTLPPLLTDSYRWRYLIVDLKKKAVVKKMTDSLDRYQFEINPELKQIIFRREADSIPQRFSYTFIDPEHLQLNGVLDGDSLYIRFKRKPKTDFRLINRKFHWVNESTYNP